MSEDTRARAGIECIKFLSKFYEDDLVVLRNYSEIINGSFRDIDLFLNIKKSKLTDILNSINTVDENHILISNIRRKNFLQLKIFSYISSEVFVIDIWDKLEWKGISYFIKPRESVNSSMPPNKSPGSPSILCLSIPMIISCDEPAPTVPDFAGDKVHTEGLSSSRLYPYVKSVRLGSPLTSTFMPFLISG